MTIDDDTDHYINTAGMTGERALMPAMAKDMIGFPGEIVRNYAENGMAYQLRHDYGISEDEAWLSLKCADLASLPAWDAEALLDAATAYLTHNSDMASRHGYVIEGNIPDDVERIKRRIRLAMLAEKAPDVMSPAAGVLLLRRAGINVFHELLDAVAFMVWDDIDPERNYRALMRIPEPQAEPPTPVVADNASNAPDQKEQRQDSRLQACIDAGLPMNTKTALLRLPDGVGAVADKLGLSRQAFSTDVKAALQRRETARRAGRS